eukprot:7378688-Prymnesium_polylepis.3
MQLPPSHPTARAREFERAAHLLWGAGGRATQLGVEFVRRSAGTVELWPTLATLPGVWDEGEKVLACGLELCAAKLAEKNKRKAAPRTLGKLCKLMTSKLARWSRSRDGGQYARTS